MNIFNAIEDCSGNNHQNNCSCDVVYSTHVSMHINNSLYFELKISEFCT